MVPDFFGNVINVNLDRLFDMIPVLYILFMMDVNLLSPVSSSASIISTELLSGSACEMLCGSHGTLQDRESIHTRSYRFELGCMVQH